MGNKREISHKYLEGKSKYEFCPWCVNEMEQNGINWQEKLRPLKLVVTAEAMKLSDGTYRDYVEKHYECIKCGRSNITEKTFVLHYCERYDGTKFNELPKEPGSIWSKEKNKFVPAKWNQVKQDWEEILDKAE